MSYRNSVAQKLFLSSWIKLATNVYIENKAKKSKWPKLYWMRIHNAMKRINKSEKKVAKEQINSESQLNGIFDVQQFESSCIFLTSICI